MSEDTTAAADGQTQSRYGFTWKWSALHPTESEIRSMLYSYDELASEALDRLDVLSPPTPSRPQSHPQSQPQTQPQDQAQSQSQGQDCPFSGQRDLYDLLQKHAGDDPVVGRLWDEVSTVPDWVDWDQLARGQEVVRQYYGQILLGVSSSGSLPFPLFSFRNPAPCAYHSDRHHHSSSSDPWSAACPPGASWKRSPAPAASA